MHLEIFADGHSFMHRLDPRVKIAAAAVFSLMTALADRPLVLAAGLIVSIGLLAWAQLNLRALLERLAVVNVFILCLWLFLPFSHEGRAAFSIGPLDATWEGLQLCLAITVKSNAIVMAVIALLSTSKVFSLVHALRHMYVPDKLVNLFFFTYRYFQVIHEEYHRLRDAMRVRCFRAGTNMHTYRSMAYLLGMLLVRSSDRSERVHQAMLCRGYRGRFWILDHFHRGRKDLAFLALMLLITSAMAIGQWAVR